MYPAATAIISWPRSRRSATATAARWTVSGWISAFPQPNYSPWGQEQMRRAGIDIADDAAVWRYARQQDLAFFAARHRPDQAQGAPGHLLLQRHDHRRHGRSGRLCDPFRSRKPAHLGRRLGLPALPDHEPPGAHLRQRNHRHDRALPQILGRFWRAEDRTTSSTTNAARSWPPAGASASATSCTRAACSTRPSTG